MQRLGLDLEDAAIIALVGRKLAVPGNEPVDVSPARLAALRSQVETDLKPVLRERDLAEFDLDRAFATVARVAKAVRAGD